MKKNYYKFFWVWNIDLEEQWLNEMSKMGLALKSVKFLKYEFEIAKPNEYSNRVIFYNAFSSSKKRQDFINFIEETGPKHIATLKHCIYFSNNVSSDDFELYSDYSSQINHYQRLNLFMIIFAILNILAGVFNIFIALKLHEQSSLININLLTGFFNIFLALFIIRGHNKIKLIIDTLKQKSKLFQ